MQVSRISEVGTAKEKEILGKELRNKYPGKGETKTDSSFSTVLHQFYYYVAH